ncbi:MAG: hypothetical protein K2I86_03795, partial [Prevotella sp.]|nr:hypothetical protein [Prevotella sp.]
MQREKPFFFTLHIQRTRFASCTDTLGTMHGHARHHVRTRSASCADVLGIIHGHAPHSIFPWFCRYFRIIAYLCSVKWQIIPIVALAVLSQSCGQKRQQPVVAPWGEITDSIPADE